MLKPKNRINKLASLASGCVLLAAAGGAQAGLLDGQTVSYTYFFPDSSSTYFSTANGNYVVGAGVEIPDGFCCNFEGSLDLSDTNILADFHGNSSYTGSAFNGFRISDVFGTIAPFTGVSINAATNMGGLDASRISFDADNIWVNWQGLFFDERTIVSLDINGGTVPEPATLALVSLGLVGIGVRRRRRG